MCFLLTCLWVWLIILRLSPTPYSDPSMTTITGESPETVRFARRVMLDGYAVVAVDWKNSNRLKLKHEVYTGFICKGYTGFIGQQQLLWLCCSPLGTLKVTQALHSTRLLYVKCRLRENNVALCAMAVVSGHTLIVVVWKRLNTCCLLLRKVVNGFVHPVYNQSFQLLAWTWWVLIPHRYYCNPK